MTDHDLSELLDRLGERAPVGPPPTHAMLAAATRSRRRRKTWVAAGTAAAVAATIGWVTLLGNASDPAQPGPADPTPTQAATPPGTRLVGIGHIAVAVPEEWGTNRLHCVTPAEDTVVVDVGGFRLCLPPYPEDVDSVWLERAGENAVVQPGEPVVIDGLRAEGVPTTCGHANGGVTVCRGSVYFPDQDVLIKAESSTSREEVDRILSWIVVVPGLVAVPGAQNANNYQQDDDAGAHYRAQLEALGLAVEVVTERQPGAKEGFVLGVEPQPGTMLAPGDTVTMTEVAAPEGPADELSVGMSTQLSDIGFQELTDAQIRRNATIQIDLGARIWIYGKGKRIGSLAGSPSGSALVLDDWKEGPNYGRSWEAVERGTSVLTITIEAEGERIVLGRVTVIVD